MKAFDDWWGKESIPSDIIPPHLEDALVDAFRAGMLASADIVSAARPHHCHTEIADKIREACDD